MKIDSAKSKRSANCSPHLTVRSCWSHITNPDGDAIGASTAWRDVLAAMGHEVTMIVPNKYPYFLDWMPDIREVVIFRFAPERALEAIRGADIVFCLDFNSLSRLEALSDALAENTAARRVLIDHHLSPDGGFDLQFSYPQSSSTCFLLYCIIEQLCGTEVITRKDGRSALCGHDDRYRQLLLLVPHAGALPRPGRPWSRKGSTWPVFTTASTTVIRRTAPVCSAMRSTAR